MAEQSTTEKSPDRERQRAFWRHVLVFGAVGGLLVAALKWVEYRWLVVTHSVEIYGALVAILFAGFGIWLGLRFTRKVETIVERVVEREVTVEVPVPASEPFIRDEKQVQKLGITPRELEILALMAEGLSNREMAEKLFVTENTIKTHGSRVFDKLEAKRRTQAVQRARELRLIA